MSAKHTTQRGTAGLVGTSLSEAARLLKMPRTFLYGALEALRIVPKYGHGKDGRMARILTEDEIDRVRRARGEK